MQLNYELTVFLIILLVVVAAIVIILVVGTRIEMAGITGVTGRAEPATMVGRDIYDLLSEYAREVGTQQHVEEYLVKNMNIKIPKQKSGRLVVVIDEIVDLYGVESVNDFLAMTGVRYKHFLPKAKRCIFDDLYAYTSLEADLETSMHLMFKEHDVVLKSSEIQKILHGYKLYKLTAKYAKKSVSVIKKAKAKAFEPDEMALRPIVAILAKLMKIGKNAEKEQKELKNILSHLDLSPLNKYEAELLNSILRRTNPIIRLELEKERLEQEKLLEKKKLQEVKTEKGQLELEKEKLEQEKTRLEREKLEREKNERVKLEREKIESEQVKEKQEEETPEPYVVLEETPPVPASTEPTVKPELEKETIEEYPELVDETNPKKTAESSTTEP